MTVYQGLMVYGCQQWMTPGGCNCLHPGFCSVSEYMQNTIKCLQMRVTTYGGGFVYNYVYICKCEKKEKYKHGSNSLLSN